MTENIEQNTETVEGILNLLRRRLASGEKPHQSGDSFPCAAFLEAMYTLNDEMLDHDVLALCVSKMRTTLRGATFVMLSAFTQQYVDAAFRVIGREQAVE